MARLRDLRIPLTTTALLVAAGTLSPRPAPAFPGGVFFEQIGFVNIATAPACGGCHSQFPPAAMNLDVSLTPTERSLTTGQSIQITTSATGGTPEANNAGGFAAEVTAGTLVPVPTITQVNATADAITHVDGLSDQGRSWTYGFDASSTPGLVEVRTVVNTVNSSGDTFGDIYGFHGPDQMVNTPVRLFVNADGVAPLGQSCEGGFGNFPVLGAPTPAQIGNTGFSFEVHGVPGGAPVFFFFGLDPNPTPLALGALAPGCELLTPLDPPNPLFLVTASSGSVPRAEGVATLPLPIPAASGIGVGDQFVIQAVVLDFGSPGVLPVSATNGLLITLF